jgi:hypothetical protein
VYHQVTPVTRGCERTTAVFSFQPRNVLALEACDRLFKTYNLVDPLHVFMADWVRYRGWKFARRIEMWQDDQRDHMLKQGAGNGSAKAQPVVEFAAAAELSRQLFSKLASSLPYTADRKVLAAALKDAGKPLTAQLKHVFATPGAEARASDEVEEQERKRVLAVCNVGASTDLLGRANFDMLLKELDNAIDDVVNLTHEDKMEYF